MELRSSGHDPTCALFITQEHVVPLPFPKPLSNLMTPKHWLQEPHLTTLHKHSGLPSMCSQYKPAQTQMKLSVAMLPGHQITKHRSWPLKLRLHCSPGSKSLPAAQVKMAITQPAKLSVKRKNCFHALLEKGAHCSGSPLTTFTSGHNTEAWTRDKWINRHFLFKEPLKKWSLIAWVPSSNINATSSIYKWYAGVDSFPEVVITTQAASNWHEVQ